MHIQVSGSGTFALIESLQLGFSSQDANFSGTAPIEIGNSIALTGLTSYEIIPTAGISGSTSFDILDPVSVSGYTSYEILPTVAISGTTFIEAISGTAPIVVSGTGTIVAGNFRNNLSGSLVVVVEHNAQSDLSGTIVVTDFKANLSGTLSVVRPSDLPGSILTVAPSYLPGQIDVIGTVDADLSGTVQTNYEFLKELPGKITVTNPQDLPGYIITAATGTSFLDGYLAVAEYQNLSGTLTTTAPANLSGTLTTTAPVDLSGQLTTTAPVDLNGEIQVIKPYVDLSGSLTTTEPSYLIGWIDVVGRHESDLSGTVTVVPPLEFSYLSGTLTTLFAGENNLSGTLVTSRDGSDTLPGEIEVIDRFNQFLSGTLQVKPYSDLPGSITTIRPSADLPGRVKVGNKEFEELSGIITIWGPVDLNGEIQVVRPSVEISGSISLVPYSDLSGTMVIESPYESLSGTLEVAYFDSASLSGTITTEKYESFLSGTLDVRGKSVDLNGYILVDKYTSSATLPGVIIVTWAAQKQDLPGTIAIFPYVDLSGSLLVERPYADLSGTITVIPRFDNNVGVDVVYAQDNYSLSVMALTPVSGTVGPDIIEIDQSDEFTWEWLPHLKVTGTDIIDIGQNDSFEAFFYGEETTEWSYPIQLTDNIISSNDFSLPTITEFDGRAYVSYNHNFNNELKRTIVVKTQEGGKRPNEKWVVSNIYPNVIDGQFVGPNAQMIHEQAHGFVLHPGPQASEANDFFESEIVFTPESYDIEGAMYRDLWETVQYQMQRQGEIKYPPEQWENNPLSEIMYGPEDVFDPIPKGGNFTPTNDDGYYQDFGNFFTGNG